MDGAKHGNHENKKIALAFVNAINSHDIDKIYAFMADDHVFVDAYGNETGKNAMKQGWAGYFSWFPDYRIEVDDVLGSGDTVVLLGHAGGTYKGSSALCDTRHWRIPAAWRVVIDKKKIKIWQVYADSKIPFDSMNGDDKSTGESKTP